MISKLAALALLSTVSAQSTVSLFFPASGDDGGFSGGIDASATVSGTLTSYVLNCASTATASSAAPTSTDSDSDDLDGADSDDLCVYLTDFAIVEGPSTMLYSSAVEEGVTVTVDCSIGGTTTAVCTDRANGTDITSTTFASSDMLFYPVTITAGDAQVTDAATTGSGSASGTASKSASGSGSGSASGSASKTASSGASATGSSATSTGGVPQITAAAWAIGAGAMMAAVAAL